MYKFSIYFYLKHFIIKLGIFDWVIWPFFIDKFSIFKKTTDFIKITHINIFIKNF